MKKHFVCALFLLVFAFLFSSTASADVLPPDDYGTLFRCVKIVNLNAFPEIALISYITELMFKGSKTSQIENDKCLPSQSLKIYWSTKDKPDAINQNNLLLELNYGGSDYDHIKKKTKTDIEYSVAGSPNKKLILYKSKQTTEYNDNSPTKIETFTSPLENSTPEPSPEIIDEPIDQPTVTPTPQPIKKSFWQSIICFFRGLFGKNCD